MSFDDSGVFTAYDDAITKYSEQGKSLFQQAQQDIQDHPLPAPPTPRTDEDKKKANQAAQGALAAAFSQLGNAARMASEQKGREGYDAIVALMVSTSTTAESVCAQIRGMFDGAHPYDQQKLQTLTAVLTALAALSPAAVWEKPSGGQS